MAKREDGKPTIIKDPLVSIFKVQDPLVIIFKEGDRNIFRIHPDENGYQGYGLLICDLVRHVARAFKVGEDDVWLWVDAERNEPTTDIIQHS